MALILITGARGAIGRGTVALAKARGHTVIGLGHGAWSGDSGLPPIDRWFNGEIDSDNLDALAHASGTPDIIIHLAGGSLVGPSISHPGEDFRRTVESSQRLLLWMRASAPAARLVVASSAAIYGDGHTGPIPEIAAASPTSPYGTHKAIMEMLCRSFARDFGLNIALLRLFSVYGQGLRKQLIWDLAARLHRRESPIVLGGTGEETRDFLYVDDAAAMLLDAAGQADQTAPAFNGCSGQATRIAALTGAVARAFSTGAPAFSGQSRQGDPVHLVGDARRSQAAGLIAATGLEEGLVRTIRWIKGELATAGR